MLLNSRGLSLILSGCIAAIVLGSLMLLPDIPNYAYWLVFFISFGTGYILINIVLEFLFFKELRSIYNMFEQIRANDLSQLEPNKKYGHSSIIQIHEEIYAYAHGKQSEIEELKQLAKFRRQFLADVSHELKTPIFAAQGFVHTLLDGAIDDKKNRMKFLKRAAKNLDGLDMLVQDLLTVSHMEAGDITMHLEPVNLCEMIFEIFDQMENNAQKTDITLKMNHERDEIIKVKADEQRIYQVLVNLITNAIKYSDEGGVVEVSVVDLGERQQVIVKDTGIGIPPEHLNRIFERFYRVDKSRARAIGGTGLGLSIVKHIVEAHDSDIHVKSTPGEGSEFSFELDKYIAQ
ncbi:two-component system, OmpR family, phosphate regulon sensor histidine kinase PhoR [Reichenbachiella agariperforans]|uniref:histidine kinase n=1 Tax=Reichenbachiella agariperforans TaxID=156994 RepID=A0A1M6LWU4_REIAG|nr:ATP-binding protein [Reichenbachiella agariperforans]SHJ75621.1 two-component system, OmpR family, phosphate regulon sensor histidine kinase PhoR [Reichenbachiella agariperforans]